MTTALYRRYRPETFEDVIGQEHVTEPLMTALRKNRVNHAYLFSGPRGCGKTTSARILARCLNCAEGPTATPCGRCESCQDLARDGAGSLDVIEMDAASHGGVDHARDLRERATFAPVRDRYKIFIIDEAHMVTREGFNALLKIVEEPPEHVKFIFATTEPSKVLTTIRSRTHHYPFRLVPPEPLMKYLEQLCREEGVATEPGVLSLVVRAGGGSVRDSLSVLDQLMAGSDENGITYDLAVALLGYTHAALLDDVVDAFAAGDAATVFASVDRVIQTGQDPRRFVEDLLERFRDLVVVNAVPDSADNILHGMPTDQINRLRNQSTQLGAAELSRSADIINEALNEMTGATSPQLHLELLCARILLPSAENTTRGITSRVDRLERRLSIPRGSGIRQGGGDAATSLPTGASEPEPFQTAPSTAASSTAAPSGSGHGEPARGESVRPGPAAAKGAPVSGAERLDDPERDQVAASSPVAPDGSAPGSTDPDSSVQGRAPEQTPDVQEPTDPQDESEEPEGSSHPAAGEPVPERERGPQAQQPPADGTVDEPDTAGSGAPERPADREAPARAPEAPALPEEQSAPSDVTSGELELLRSSWPEIVSALAEIRRVAWAITVRGTPISYENSTLRIAFEGDGDILNFPRFEADVRSAIQTVVGLDCGVEAVRPGDTQGRSDGQGPGSAGPRGTGPGGAGPSGAGPAGPGPDGRGPSGRGPRGGGSGGTGPDGRAPRGSGTNSEGPTGSGATGERAGNRRGSGDGRGERGSGRAPAGRPEASGHGPAGEQPEYFREPEGFGVNRRRGGESRTSNRSPESSAEPSPEDDEPVTSWTVASIPQSGAASDSAQTSTEDTQQSGAPGSSGTSEPERIPASVPETVGAGAPAAPGGAGSSPNAGSGTDRSPGAGPGPGAGRGVGTGAEPSDHADSRADEDAARGPEDSADGSLPSDEPATVDPGMPAPGTSVPTPGPTPRPDAERPASRGRERGPEYWSPEEPPPPPEDEPPADMYEMYDGPLSRTRPTPQRQGTPSGPRGPEGPREATVSSGPGGTAQPDASSGGTVPGGAAGTAPRGRPSWRERHADAIAAARAAEPSSGPRSDAARGAGNTVEDEHFVPGADDESLEDSSLYGRAAIERILGGMVIDERAHDATS